MQNKNRKKIDNYIIDLGAKIGEGAFGEVFKGVEDKTNREVAIKVLSKKKSKINHTQSNPPKRHTSPRSRS